MEPLDGGTQIQPIYLGMSIFKVGANWLVRMAQYISDNPHLIVTGLFAPESFQL